MFRKIFSFSNATLLVALTLSTIAAWYSIVGLTAIFAGAVVPIIIMGTALEFGKVVTTVWLRKYWYRCSMIMKLYLVPAVFFLAVLTSMGIFGFLSKAHMDQGIVSGDAIAKVSLYDEKIAIQKDIVKSSKSMLAQMDMQVNDIMTKGDSEKSVERSVTIRKQQQKERASLQKDIENANKEIQKLNEERAPLAAETRKIEAEVGPIKYIAALIYGDNPDQNVLEKAVRWVIIMLVAVFDPLALVLVVAANQSKEWDENIDEESKLKEQVEHEKVMAEIQEEFPVNQEVLEELQARAGEEDLTEINHELQEAAVHEEPFIEVPEAPVEDTRTMAEKYPYLNQPFAHFENTQPIVATKEEPVVEEVNEVVEEPIVEKVKEETKEVVEEPKILAMGVDVIERPGDYLNDLHKEATGGQRVHGTSGVKLSLDGEYVVYEGRKMSVNALRGIRPDLFSIREDGLRMPEVGFGQSFPSIAIQGDIFVRTDVIPNKVYHFNGINWIEKQRSYSDTYLTNDDYIQFLVEKISTGEYDPELLTEVEQDTIAEYISRKN